MARLAQIGLAVALLYAAAVAAEVPVPPLESRVTDLTATLSPDQRSALERKLAAFEGRKGSQVAVLLVPTTQPETVEQYAIRVFDEWKLGRKGVSDGALLLVAKNDRKLRIEVGYGLEGVLPDAIAKRIIEEEIVPRFKQGDFHGGIAAGVDRALRVIDGEPLPPPRPAPRALSGGAFEYLLPALFIVVVLGTVLRRVLGRVPGSGVVGVATGILGYVLAGLVVALILGFIAFVISLFIDLAGRSGSGRSSGRWSSGGSWSSGGDWSSGGGGFSGGGGSSGGGGASGSW